MSSKESLAAALYKKWESIQAQREMPSKCFIGFDGFTDEIIDAVDQRINSDDFTPFSHIARFGQRIVDASGKSCNLELVVRQVKIGGNAPIMTNALISGGHELTFCGPIGTAGQIEPIFQEMARGCKRVIPLGPSAHSDAIEFKDGKVILGKLDALKNVNYRNILTLLPRDELISILDQSDLFVSANWTMLPMMNDLWEHFLKEIIPHFNQKKTRHLFVDLADPAKRTDSDLVIALDLLQQLNTPFEVNLGLNEAEARRIYRVIKGGISPSPKEADELAKAIQQRTRLHRVIVHTTALAAAADEQGVVSVQGPFTASPKITTGAGDNFNAGFCTALLYKLSPKECLLAGAATSGFYVRRGYSPTISELAAFLLKWEATADAQLLE